MNEKIRGLLCCVGAVVAVGKWIYRKPSELLEFNFAMLDLLLAWLWHGSLLETPENRCVQVGFTVVASPLDLFNE